MAPIYLDHAASTSLLPEAWEAMRSWALRAGNAASSHSFGRAARQALDDARERVAQCLNAGPDEVVFTSGATEANNLALFGLAGVVPGTVLASPIEHPCVSEPIQQLVGRGWAVSRLTVARDGIVGPLPSFWPDDLRLATLMLANHETGAIQPVRALRDALPATVALHCDAAVAVGKMPVSFGKLGATTLTLSGHKFHGPQGIGALLVKKGTRLPALFFGGHQQRGKRPGTEPVALAVGMAAALEVSCRTFTVQVNRVRQLRSQLIGSLENDVPPVVVNGPDEGVPHILNIAFPGIRSDALLMALDLAGIACSTGSACSSGSLLPSPVLRAMNVPSDVLHSAMRFSFSATLRSEEIADAAKRIAQTVKRLRQQCGVSC